MCVLSHCLLHTKNIINYIYIYNVYTILSAFSKFSKQHIINLLIKEKPKSQTLFVSEKIIMEKVFEKSDCLISKKHCWAMCPFRIFIYVSTDFMCYRIQGKELFCVMWLSLLEFHNYNEHWNFDSLSCLGILLCPWKSTLSILISSFLAFTMYFIKKHWKLPLLPLIFSKDSEVPF